MKRLTLILCAITATFAVCYAGPEPFSGKDKEVIQPEPPPCEWYHAHEWNLDMWGAYAFSAQAGHRDLDFDYEEVDNEYDLHGRPVFLGEPVKDHFLNRDDAWGGGADIKYFWSRYFGAGVEGFILNARNTAGAALGTFTVRYPIGCSRFAPYAFGGFGVVAGGSHTERFFFENEILDDEIETEYIKNTVIKNNHARVIGQLGTGMEVRITRPSAASKLAIGLMGDFTWNFIGGDHSADQNFGMARVGLDFSY